MTTVEKAYRDGFESVMQKSAQRIPLSSVARRGAKQIMRSWRAFGVAHDPRMASRVRELFSSMRPLKGMPDSKFVAKYTPKGTTVPGFRHDTATAILETRRDLKKMRK